MQKINYNELMKKEIASIQKSGSEKPTLLLHSCCGPCSTGCLERLIDHFDITLFFYNPNIDPLDEYELRIQAQKDVIQKIPQFNNVKLIIPEKNEVDFYPREEFVQSINLEKFPERKTEKEGLSRCLSCYRFRLEKTFDYALKNGFDYWCTTLTLGPQKDAQKINTVADEIQLAASDYKIKKPILLHADFKKDGGYLRSIQLCKEFGIYRQHYCGCVFGR